jgi:hypothetical protein
MPIKPKEVNFEENICFKEQKQIKNLKSNGLKLTATFESKELKGKIVALLGVNGRIGKSKI